MTKRHIRSLQLGDDEDLTSVKNDEIAEWVYILKYIDKNIQ